MLQGVQEEGAGAFDKSKSVDSLAREEELGSTVSASTDSESGTDVESEPDGEPTPALSATRKKRRPSPLLQRAQLETFNPLAKVGPPRPVPPPIPPKPKFTLSTAARSTLIEKV